MSKEVVLKEDVPLDNNYWSTAIFQPNNAYVFRDKNRLCIHMEKGGALFISLESGDLLGDVAPGH